MAVRGTESQEEQVAELKLGQGPQGPYRRVSVTWLVRPLLVYA